MKNNDCLFSDIQNLCNAVSDWLIKKKSIIQLKPTRQYPVPVVTSCVITAEPVKKFSSSVRFVSGRLASLYILHPVNLTRYFSPK